jgi:transcriptional regulator with XRE-family HTH domain
MALPSPQHTAQEQLYARRVKVERPPVAQILAVNLTALMLRRDWAQAQLAAKSGVSQRHISNVLRKKTSCSVQSLEALAGAFGLPGWLLLIEDLEVELMDSPSIPRLVKHFSSAGPDGRDLVSRQAERESVHNLEKNKIAPFQRLKSGQ